MLDKGGQKVAGLAEEEGEKGCPKLCVLPKRLDSYIADPALCKVMREGRECQAGHQSCECKRFEEGLAPAELRTEAQLPGSQL